MDFALTGGLAIGLIRIGRPELDRRLKKKKKKKSTFQHDDLHIFLTS